MTAQEIKLTKEKMARYKAEALETFAAAQACTWDEASDYEVLQLEAECAEAKANALYWLLHDLGVDHDE